MDFDALLAASSAGGSTCLTSVTELRPAAGPFSSIAPAKFAARNTNGVYAYEDRYLDGTSRTAVIVDSKQSQLNRVEQALRLAIDDGHPLLSRMPRIVVSYTRAGVTESWSDLDLPHRAFDGHIRAGSTNGTPVPQLDAYRAIRNAGPKNARALLDTSPVSLVFGSWDATRAQHQGRWRSALVGEIVGFCESTESAMKGGARVDPVGMQVNLTAETLSELADRQKDELSGKTYDKAKTAARSAKKGVPVSGSALGLGGIPPTLETLAGVSCDKIIRSHVLSFAALRQIRFGAGTEGDTACRALLAALALNGLARADSELVLRANCDLVEASPTVVKLDDRGGKDKAYRPLTINAADELLATALAHAEKTASVLWNGPALEIDGDPAIFAGAEDDSGDTSDDKGN